MSMLTESPAPAPSPVESAEPSFESRLNRKLGGDGGAPLASDVAAHAGATYATDLSNVRVHSDPEAGQMADAKGFQAFSYGADVFTKPGATDTNTESGSYVMMHELAHVAQSGGQREAGVHGKAQIGTATDANETLEVDADRGADAAMAGGTHQVQSAPLMVRGFGATAGRDRQTGARNTNDVVHENQTRNAAETVGFSARDSEMMYSGNWQRDMNQFLIPKMRSAGPIIFSAMDLVHTLHFGFPIGSSIEGSAKPGNSRPGNAVAEFGTYDPVEHIDNPGGLTGADVNRQSNPDGSDADSAAGSTNIGRAGESYADADTRYNEQYQRAIAAGHTIENPTEQSAAFRVDDSGIPIYLQTSRHALIQTLKRGLDTAGSGTGPSRQANYDRALRSAGEALHVMQDYYAHSNFCEVGINILLDEHFNERGAVDASGGRSLVDVLNLSQFHPDHIDLNTTRNHLNTYVHSRGPGGQVASANMTTGGGREVMATGTFTLEDTMQSIKEKVGLALHSINPFTPGGPAGPSEKALRMLTWFESNPQYFPFDGAGAAQWCGEKLVAVMPAINALASGGNTLLGAQGAVSSAMDRGWGNVRGAWHSLVGNDEAATAARADGQADSARHQADAARRQQTLANLQTELQSTSTLLAGGGSLRALYEWAYKAGSHMKLSSLARMIPLVGDQVAELVEKAVKEVKEWLRARFEAAWTSAMQQFTAEFNAAVAVSLGSSEVSDQTGAQTMTQPTHTDIAKDFDSHQHGTEDRFSIIEEVGEFMRRAGSARAAGNRMLGIAREQFDRVMAGQTGIVDGVRTASQQLGTELSGPAAEEQGHQHQHRHAGAWLAPLAGSLATQSSEAILRPYRAGLTKAQAGQDTGTEKSQVEAITHEWFAHPADCRGKWQGQFMTVLQGDSVDAVAIKTELARRRALPPAEQSTNDEQTTGHSDRHGDHDDGDNDHGHGREWRPDGHDHAGHDHDDHDHDDHAH